MGLWPLRSPRATPWHDSWLPVTTRRPLITRIHQDTIAPRPWSVRQNGWTNDRPVEPTAPDNAFLHILVGVNAIKEEVKGGVVEKAAVATAVPCPEAGHADQALDRAVLHGIDEHPRRGGKEPRAGDDQA